MSRADLLLFNKWLIPFISYCFDFIASSIVGGMIVGGIRMKRPDNNRQTRERPLWMVIVWRMRPASPICIP